MRYRDINEAPISDYVYREDGEATSFTARDKKFIQNGGQEKIIRAFRKTPHDFVVHFRAHDGWDAHLKGEHDRVNTHMNDVGVGVWKEAYGVEGEPGRIHVVLLGNLSSDGYKPMSGWTLAHKIGHGIMDANSLRTTGIMDLKEPINLLSKRLNWLPGDYIEWLTMKSARDRTQLPGEALPELLAQYLITGRVTLSREQAEKDGIDIKRLEKVERLVNKAAEGIFHALEGWVIVEV